MKKSASQSDESFLNFKICVLLNNIPNSPVSSAPSHSLFNKIFSESQRRWYKFRFRRLYTTQFLCAFTIPTIADKLSLKPCGLSLFSYLFCYVVYFPPPNSRGTNSICTIFESVIVSRQIFVILPSSASYLKTNL